MTEESFDLDVTTEQQAQEHPVPITEIKGKTLDPVPWDKLRDSVSDSVEFQPEVYSRVTLTCPKCSANIVTLFRREDPNRTHPDPRQMSYPVEPGSTRSLAIEVPGKLGSWSYVRNLLTCPASTCTFERRLNYIQTARIYLFAIIFGHTSIDVPATPADDMRLTAFIDSAIPDFAVIYTPTQEPAPQINQTEVS